MNTRMRWSSQSLVGGRGERDGPLGAAGPWTLREHCRLLSASAGGASATTCLQSQLEDVQVARAASAWPLWSGQAATVLVAEQADFLALCFGAGGWVESPRSNSAPG